MIFYQSCSNYFDWLKTWPPGGVGPVFPMLIWGILLGIQPLKCVCFVSRVFPLILGRFLRRTRCIPLDFGTQIAAIRLGLSIIYFKWSQVDISK